MVTGDLPRWRGIDGQMTPTKPTGGAGERDSREGPNMIQDPNNGTETITSGLDRRTALKAALGGAAAAAVVAGPSVNGLGVLPAYAQNVSPPPSWSGSNSGQSAGCVVDEVSTACCWGTFNASTNPRCSDATFTPRCLT